MLLQFNQELGRHRKNLNKMSLSKPTEHEMLQIFSFLIDI